MSSPDADLLRAAITRGGIVLKGFRDFILRGNIVDLAVGVVIGVAFNALVMSLTNDFIQPLIKLAGGGGVSAGGFKVHGVVFNWSDFVNGVITFVITAAVIYFLVVQPMNLLLARMHRNNVSPPPAPPTDETLLLREIRDILLRNPDLLQGAGAAVAAGAPVAPPSPRTATSDTPVTDS